MFTVPLKKKKRHALGTGAHRGPLFSYMLGLTQQIQSKLWVKLFVPCSTINDTEHVVVTLWPTAVLCQLYTSNTQFSIQINSQWHLYCHICSVNTQPRCKVTLPLCYTVIFTTLSAYNLACQNQDTLTLTILMWRIGWAHNKMPENSGLADGMFLWPCIPDTII